MINNSLYHTLHQCSALTGLEIPVRDIQPLDNGTEINLAQNPALSLPRSKGISESRLKQHFLFFLFTSIIKFLCREDRLIQCWMNLWLNHGISLTNISHSPGMTAGPNMSYITFSVCTAIENSNWIVGRSTTCRTDYSKLVTCDHWTTITSFRSSSNNATSILRLHLEENAL